MNALVNQLLRQSLTGGWMILALVLLRPLIKKLPRWISCLLWALAAIRLAIPYSFESRMSLVPQTIAAPTRLTAITPLTAQIPLTEVPLQQAAPVVNESFSLQSLLPVLWLVGVAVMMVYALISCIRLLRRVQVSIRIGKRLYLCDDVKSPFILGIFRPRIYLPSDLKQPTADFVLAHEQTHLRRGDHLWKPLGYVLLSIFWFNPLCWVGYILFCRDIEQACDEAVIRDMSPSAKKAYSTALLQCSLPGHAVAACPLAFGEVGVKQRIQGILSYRKPKFWVMVFSAVLCAVLAVGFLTNPAEAVTSGNTDSQEATQDTIPMATVYNGSGEQHSFTQQTTILSAPSFGSREVAQAEAGETYYLIRREPIAGSDWGYVECPDRMLMGWILLEEGENEPLRQEIQVYSSPSEDGRTIYTLASGEDYTILDRQPIGNTVWGYIECQNGKTQGWIPLVEAPGTIITGTVIGPDNVNVRSGPGAYSSVVGYLTPDTKVTIYETVSIDDLQWGCLGGDSWVCMRYIEHGEIASGDLEAASENTSEGSTAESDSLSRVIKVYSSPSVDGRVLCELALSEDYTVLERTTVGNQLWAYVECKEGTTRGWIFLMIGSESDTFLSGTVTAERVNVRSGPGTTYSAVGYLEAGSKVTILDIVSEGSRQWGCIGPDTWVSMNYIECQQEVESATEATLQTYPSETEAETITFREPMDVYSSPSEQARPLGKTEKNETCTILRREFIADGSWAYLFCPSGNFQGWVHLVEEDEALNYFREYVNAYSQPEPDEAEQYLYFGSEYAREFFRDNYYPVTGWYPSGIFRVNDKLWGIQFTDPDSGRTVYSFVGRMDERLYVFQNVHQVPEALSENLDVKAYEEENAMYLSDGYMECYSIIKKLLPFAAPTYVTVEDKGSKDYSTAAPYPIEDMICGTDTWRVVPEPSSYGSPSCTITLTARDGSVATIRDSSPVILVNSADGTQQYYESWASGEELVGMLYSWAKSIEWAPEQ